MVTRQERVLVFLLRLGGCVMLLAWLAERGLPSLLALTKVDKLKPMRRAERVRLLRDQSGLAAERVIATSAEKGIGIPELWKAFTEAASAPQAP